MIRNEERTGLVLTVAGGAALLALLLWMLGFFHEGAPPPKAAAHATPKRSGVIAGELSDARTGKPVESATIEITGLDGVSDHWLAPPDPEHPLHFEVRSVPAERDFTLEIAAPGYATARKSTRVAAGATIDVGTVKLVPLATITGTAVDANYAALGGAEVVAIRSEAAGAIAPELPRRTTTKADARGAFRLEGLAPDSWNVQAKTAEGESTPGTQVVDATRGGVTDPLELELFPPLAPGTALLESKNTCSPAPPAGVRELVVRVVDEAARPLAGAWVELTLDDSDVRGRITARDGTTTFRGIPERAAHAWSIEARHRGRSSFNAAPVRTARTGTGVPFELRCVPTHALVVKVLDPDGNPVYGANIGVLVPRKRAPKPGVAADDGPTASNAPVDMKSYADGTAHFTSLPPPPWTISVEEARFETFTTTDANPDADDTFTVKLVRKSGG